MSFHKRGAITAALTKGGDHQSAKAKSNPPIGGLVGQPEAAAQRLAVVTQRRAMAAKRRAARLQKSGGRRRKQITCEKCFVHTFPYQPSRARFYCEACAETTVVFDRDNGIGRIPANLLPYIQ